MPLDDDAFEFVRVRPLALVVATVDGAMIRCLQPAELADALLAVTAVEPRLVLVRWATPLDEEMSVARSLGRTLEEHRAMGAARSRAANWPTPPAPPAQAQGGGAAARRPAPPEPAAS